MKRLIVYLFVWLAVLIGCTTEADRSRMRSSLDSINMLNRNGQPFTIDDVQPYVSFFDDHGTANDRLLAHYLLGRAYHEAGEAPMALECYQHALECADTTAVGCDYYQLSRVHAQMAELYYQLHLYSLQIEAYRNAIKFSLKSGNEQAAMNDLEQVSSGYEQMGMSDSALFFLDSITSWYEHRGLLQDAAITRGRSLSLLISQKNYQKAKDYMASYERLSGLFNDTGDIEKGYEIYYYYKGLVMLSEAKLDSAEYFFHKELALGKDLNNQNAGASGLVLLYESRHMPDSALKYSKYSYTVNDSLFLYTASEDINRMKAMHDYSRMQQFANKKTEEANHERERRNILLCVILFAVLVGYELYRRSVKAYSKLDKSYQTIQKIQQRITHLEAERDRKVSEIETEKEQHDKDVASISQKYDKRIEQLRDRVDSVQREAFERIGRGRAIYRAALRNTPIRSREDEKCLIEYYSVFHYESYHKWMEEYEDLTIRYLVILILQEMGKPDSDIEQLLCVSSGALRTAKSRINAKKKS